ncbi:hypothetical protein HYH02_005347 [Chlamydomonas schloesseri]|uniref:N-acetyl-D-glucosamine kinase n=1 Tax=Chlamydomonas schloesseri TaxID=2026947 RepID=A0A835WM99_9CHLO|nr:hypothetical protein HYH02_005347 [Chlamydomonas schloesseri]|eukprot:KAG2449824.1 hypothetical protein HYH02_005347 [Chlamydomonas schloesseri]
MIIGAQASPDGLSLAILDDNRRVLARSRFDSSLAWDINTNVDAAAAEIVSAVKTCCSALSSGVEAREDPWLSISILCVGTTALDHGGAEAEAAFRSALQKLLPPGLQLMVYHSAAVALASGTGGPLVGCVLLVGQDTSRAYGAVADRRTASSSGWGPVFSDGGCAYALASLRLGPILLLVVLLVVLVNADVGMRALAAVSRAQDGRGADTLLVSAVWARGHSSIHSRVAGVASLAPVVLECAARGDTVADALLRHAVGELLRAVKSVAGRLGLDKSRLPFNLVLAGPMLSEGSLFMQYLLDVLKDGVPTADVIYPQGDGAEAAAWLALWLLNPQLPLPPVRRGL